MNSQNEEADLMAEINAPEGRIAEIARIIDEMAFQANVVALHAAVEAARAGEAGMGFAAIADEAGNLTRRCAQAAKHIAQSSHGASEADLVNRELRSLTEQTLRVKGLLDAVSSGSEEQTALVPNSRDTGA